MRWYPSQGGDVKAVLYEASLGPATQEMKGLCADERDRFAHLDKRFHLRPFFLAEPVFIVSVHQLLQAAIGFRWETETADGFHPFDGRRNN